MRALVLALALAACASPNGPGQSVIDMNTTDAAPLGSGAWLISCEVAASSCAKRAALVCPAGYETGAVTPVQTQRGAISPYGGGFGTRTDYTMQVVCK